jgi:imidazolonepropionase-like amidohydrolase
MRRITPRESLKRMQMLGLALAAYGLTLAPLPIHPQAPPTDGAAAPTSLLVHAERLIVRPGEELANQDVLVQDGVIVAIGVGLSAPEGARKVSGKVVCAGFFDAWSSLGLDASSASDEGASPSMRTVDAVDRYSDPGHLADALRAGVTSVRAQAGGPAMTCGFGAVVRLDPLLEAPAALVIAEANLAATVGTPRGGRDRDIFDRVSEIDRVVGLVEGGRKYREDWNDYRDELVKWQEAVAEKEKELEKDFKKAKKDREKAVKEAEEKGKEFKEERFKEDKKPREPKLDADSEAAARAADGSVPLVVEVHRAEEIRGLLAKTQGFERLRLIFAGATESVEHAKALAKRHIPVIVWPRPGEPSGDEWDGHDLTLAGRLAEAGVEVLIGSGGSDTSRELRLLAALAVSKGLDRDKALNAITLGPARAFDVADKLGSVERGKDADLLVIDGDPLDTTARIRFVISQGRVVVEQ